MEENSETLKIPTNQDECTAYYQHLFPTNKSYCNAAWDSIACWPPTPNGTFASIPCLEILTNGHIISADNSSGAAAYRICSDGNWLWGSWTNYTECLPLLNGLSTVPIFVSYILFVGSLLSSSSLILSLAIFNYFKSLQCSRLQVHKNLVLALFVHSTTLFVLSSPVVLNHNFLSVDWFCKGILSAKMYSLMAAIMWMFVEGLLLHSRVTVCVFQSTAPLKSYYIIGWVLPTMCTTAWVLAMNNSLYSHCWQGYGRSPFIWIITGPMLAALLTNTIFLVNIVKILIAKLRTNITMEMAQVKKTIKATLLLFTLLGTTNLLFCINPQDDAHLEEAYMITNAFLQSLQGLVVSTLYCFLNSEVQNSLWKAYLRRKIRCSLNQISKCPISTTGTRRSQCELSDIAPPKKPLNKLAIPNLDGFADV